MKGFILAILLFSAAGSCDAAIREWTEQEQRLYHSYITLSAVDTWQTYQMIECQQRPHCPLVEMNPCIGKRPSKVKVKSAQ